MRQEFVYTHKKKLKVRNLAGHGGQAYNPRAQGTRVGRPRV